MTFCLLFIEFCLKFRSHLIVTVLCLFEIDSDLMDICKCIKVLVLIHVYVWLFVKVFKARRILENDLLLELFVLSSELILLSKLFFNGLYKISLHLVLTWKFSNFISVLTIFITVLVHIRICTLIIVFIFFSTIFISVIIFIHFICFIR